MILTDNISNGRFELGMGAGWNEMESTAYGIELGSLKERSDRLEEGMEVICSLLTNTVTNHKGEYYELTDAWCEPRSVQAKIPIVIGGTGRKRTLRTVARFADQWDMTFPDSPAAWQEGDMVLREHCGHVGRDQSTIKRSIHLGYDTDSVPEQMVENAEEFFEAGVDVVVWSLRGPVDPARLAPLAEAIG